MSEILDSSEPQIPSESTTVLQWHAPVLQNFNANKAKNGFAAGVDSSTVSS